MAEYFSITFTGNPKAFFIPYLFPNWKISSKFYCLTLWV